MRNSLPGAAPTTAAGGSEIIHFGRGGLRRLTAEPIAEPRTHTPLSDHMMQMLEREVVGDGKVDMRAGGASSPQGVHGPAAAHQPVRSQARHVHVAQPRAAPSAMAPQHHLLPDLPESFICAISHDMMHDPVVCADGHSYERKAIETWLEEHSTSPATGAHLPNKTLLPNHALRNSIQESLERTDSHKQHREEAAWEADALKTARLTGEDVTPQEVDHEGSAPQPQRPDGGFNGDDRHRRRRPRLKQSQPTRACRDGVQGTVENGNGPIGDGTADNCTDPGGRLTRVRRGNERRARMGLIAAGFLFLIAACLRLHGWPTLQPAPRSTTTTTTPVVQLETASLRPRPAPSRGARGISEDAARKILSRMRRRDEELMKKVHERLRPRGQ